LARGDRRLAGALLAVDRPTLAVWRKALAQVGLSMPELLGERPTGEPLPWDFIHSGVQAGYLDRETRRAETARTSLPCPPDDCIACGVCD
jgi:hypothetical protein